ncbi:MAG TPA: hypothetical protein VK666_26995 [Chryseolinea sp.]|nr:hypothetical protein [Chryseolinea sp.]
MTKEALDKLNYLHTKVKKLKQELDTLDMIPFGDRGFSSAHLIEDEAAAKLIDDQIVSLLRKEYEEAARLFQSYEGTYNDKPTYSVVGGFSTHARP